jgi:hypothetical protein
MRWRWVLAAILALLPGRAIAEPTDSYAISVGAWDAFQDRRSAETGAEYRLTSWKLFPKDRRFKLIPTVGLLLTSSQVTYVYTGLRFEIPLDDERFFFIPHSAAGFYRGGSPEDLGGPLEFRNGLELAFAFHEQSRVGLNFFHISNANIYQTNPGAETLAISMQFYVDNVKSQHPASK